MKYFLSPDNPQIYKNLLRHLAEMNPNVKWEVSIDKAKPRSKTWKQRNYFHALLDIFCDETGNDVDDLKLKLKFRVLPLNDVIIEGVVHKYPPSSESITAEQYSHLIEAIQMLCVEYDIQYPQPEHYG